MSENIIKRYQGKLGEVTITVYEDDQNNKEFRVAHSGIPEAGGWYKEKREAIVHAQFLAGKY